MFIARGGRGRPHMSLLNIHSEKFRRRRNDTLLPYEAMHLSPLFSDIIVTDFIR